MRICQLSWLGQACRSTVSRTTSRLQQRHVGSNTRAAIGIDLGTTQSCVAHMDGTQPRVLADDQGRTTTPSIVAFGETKLVGYQAKAQAALQPESTLFATKRLIGRQYNDPLVQIAQQQCSYQIVKGPNGEAWIQLPGQTSPTSPSQIAADVLEKMKAIAEAATGEAVTDVVITVPAYFNDNQRQATRNAGKLAGLNVMRVVNEPTAAAIAYGLGVTKQPEAQHVAVYDLGGGTFDVSILSLDDDGVFEVLATNGNTFLGGEDVDAAVATHLRTVFENTHQLQIPANSLAANTRLREAAEKAKIALDNKDSVEVEVPFLHEGKSLRTLLQRSTFDQLISTLLDKTREPCMQCIKDSGIKTDSIDKVLLVGGMTRSHAVREMVADIFGQIPDASINPLEAVARGAAIQAGILTGQVRDVLLLDVTPLSMGIETLGGLMNVLIPRNTSVPARQTQVFSTGVDNQTKVAIRVYQGERPVVNDNHMLGEFSLTGIKRAPKGTPRIEVTFDINADGIVQVSAKDLETGQEQEIELRSSGGMTQQEIEALLQAAEQEKGQDADKIQRAKVAAEMQVLITDVSANLEHFRAQLADEDIARLEKMLADASESADNASLTSTALQQHAVSFVSEAAKCFRAASESKQDN